MHLHEHAHSGVGISFGSNSSSTYLLLRVHSGTANRPGWGMEGWGCYLGFWDLCFCLPGLISVLFLRQLLKLGLKAPICILLRPVYYMLAIGTEYSKLPAFRCKAKLSCNGIHRHLHVLLLALGTLPTS